MKGRAPRIAIGLLVVGLLVGAGYWLYTRGWPVHRRGRGVRGLREYHGTVEVRTVRLAFEIPGRITTLHCEEGKRIRQGEVVATVDASEQEVALKRAEALLEARRAQLAKALKGPRPQAIVEARAGVKAAEAQLQTARAAFGRTRRLYEKKVVSQEAFDKAKNALSQAEARLKQARARLSLLLAGTRKEDIQNLKALVREAQLSMDSLRLRLRKATLVSPVDGVVETRIRERGEVVRPGEPVCVLAVPSPKRVRIYVEEPDLDGVHVGLRARVMTDGGHTLEGSVSYVSPRAQFTPKTVQTRSLRTQLVYMVKVDVPDPGDYLKQGMPVTVVLGRGR